MRNIRLKNIFLLSVFIFTFIAGLFIGGIVFTPPKPSLPVQTVEYGNAYMIPVLELEVRDRDGNLLQTYRKIGDPPTLNFIKLMMVHAYWCSSASNKQLYNTSCTDVSGTARTMSSTTYGRFYDQSSSTVLGVGYQSMKIMVGDGDTAFNVNQFKLQGSWTSDVLMNTFICFYNSTHMWSQYQGTWTNNLGSTKTVKECGLFGNVCYSSSSTAWFMFFRDTFSVVVPNGGSLTVTYRLYFRYA